MNTILIRRLKNLQRWESGTIRLLGLIEVMLAAALLVNSLFAAYMHEDAWKFGLMVPFLGGFGLFQILFFSSKEKMSSAIGILLIAEMWILAFIVSSIPFMLYGMSPVDSFFEGISGYTTTGATVISGLENTPKSLLLWRGIIQWTGGITVLISFSFLLPRIGMGGAGLSSNEFTSSGNDNYSLKITSASLNFFKIYIMLTVAEILCLIPCGVPSFDSVCIALSNIPTGGLLPRDSSMADYSFMAQFVTLVFMILGATNFYLMFRAIFKKDKSLFKSHETWAMLEWFAICSALIFVSATLNYDYYGYSLNSNEYVDTAWKSIYCVVSSGTGTGFGLFSYNMIPSFMFLVLMIVEFMGGTSGSTAGGIKIYRMMILKSYIVSNINKVLHPNAVASIRANGSNMNEEAVGSALSTVFLFLVFMFIGLGLIMILEDGNLGDDPVETSFGIVLAALSNAGIGPLDNYSALTIGSKVVMCFLMWLGRMEIILVIILFTRGFWNDIKLSIGKFGSSRGRRRANREGRLKKRNE